MKKISSVIRFWLFICIVCTFCVTNILLFILQDKLAKNNCQEVLTTAISDIQKDIRDNTDYDLLWYCNNLKDALEELSPDDTDAVESLCNAILNLDLGVINIVAKNRHVGQNGSVLIADNNGRIITYSQNSFGKTLSEINLDLSQTEPDKVFQTELFGESFHCMFDTEEDYTILSMIPTTEVLLSRNVALTATSLMEIIIFAVLFAIVLKLFSNLIVVNLKSINRTLSEITRGNLDELADVHDNLEFSSLSDHINMTVATLKQYISDAEERNIKDLELAKTIQLSTMPKDFFTDKRDFNVYASMDTAKEVGGDFYDLFYVDDHTFNIVIADVSGKGIPAALFMMRAKTLIKSLATRGIPPHEVFRIANTQLCDENDAEMFVTAWMASINLEDGHVIFANAGHNPPLLKRADGSWEYLEMKPGLVLAGMPGVPYKPQMIQLHRGDSLYLYTDGVTEAVGPENELYGEQRLQDTLNAAEPAAASEDADFAAAQKDVKGICDSVRLNVNFFAAGEAQADDITMLAFNYIGKREPLVIRHEEAEIADITEITEKIDEELEILGCPPKARMQLDIVIDEIYSNIVKNAYPDSKGPATVILAQCDDEKSVLLTFQDNGIPYNPLRKEDPDITLSAADRQIGGLGIFMTKKAVDEMSYEYKNETNILNLKKQILI